MSRRVVLAIVAAVSVLAAGLGWVLGQQIQSPAEVAAATSAPEPSLITVPVELRELSSRVVTRGTVQSDEETSIDIAGAAEGTPIVTGMTKEAGDELDEGEVVIEITGRPVIALEGVLPVYRPMGPGMEGPDIEQLEAALLRLGHDPGEVDGRYTASTADAVENLYRSVGYKPNGVTSTETTDLKNARDRVTNAEKQVKQAGSSSSSGGVPESVRLQQNQQVEQAERILSDAKQSLANSGSDTKAAVDQATNELADAEKNLATANDRLAMANGGTHPDTGTAPTDDEIAVLEAAVADQTALVAAATDALAAAKAAHDGSDVELARAVTDAETGVAIAVATRKETFESYTSGGGELSEGPSLADAKKELADAREALLELQTTTGVRFAAFELVFVPTLPRKVQSVAVELGSAASGSVMSVTGTSTVLQSAVSSADRKLLIEGLEAVIEDDQLGISAPATITFLADDPGGNDLPADRYAMRLTPTGDIPEEAFYESLKVTIPISSTGGEVLAVPLAAVSAAADGTSRVEVQEDDGSTRLVDVVTGLAADGFVEVSPQGGDLEEGDRVVVGRDLQLPGSADADEEDGDGEASDE